MGVGFLARALVEATLPHSDPRANEFVRRNGHLTLSILVPKDVGLPYGRYPRLLLAYLTTEAVRRNSPDIDLASLRAELVRAVEAKVAPAAAPPGKPAPEMLHPAGSPFRISAGALIPAVLTAGINSDLPGQTTALVRRNVYDSRTGRYLLVPQGSRLVGEYDSRVAFGQNRVFVAWNRLRFPDGRSLDLAGMQGADLAAAAGLRDRVNNHFVRTFGSALLIAAVSAGVQLSQPDEDGNFQSGPTPSQLAAAVTMALRSRSAPTVLSLVGRTDVCRADAPRLQRRLVRCFDEPRPLDDRAELEMLAEQALAEAATRSWTTIAEQVLAAAGARSRR